MSCLPIWSASLMGGGGGGGGAGWAKRALVSCPNKHRPANHQPNTSQTTNQSLVSDLAASLLPYMRHVVSLYCLLAFFFFFFSLIFSFCPYHKNDSQLRIFANYSTCFLTETFFIMGQEDAVYLAKLAEQAERYEGSSTVLVIRPCPVPVLTLLLQRWSRT